MIGVRRALLFLVALCVVGFACVATANMIQNRPTGETVFDNGGQRWPFFSQVAVANYDNGGQGVGYNVPTPDPVNCSAGASYRADAVNLKTSVAGAPAIPFQIGCNGSPNGFNYSINISQPGPYQITLQLSDTSTGGSEAILLDGVQVASVPTPNTGSFDTFASSTSGPFTSNLGNHLLTLKWGTGDTMFNGAGDILTWQGSQAPPTAINSVSISCGNSCTFAPGTAGTVGRAQATMSIGSFAGSWSLRTSGTDNFNTPCVNYSGGFAINSSTGDVSNGALAAGSYPGVCLVATQAGAGGSPFALAVTITGTGCAAPSVAAAAGFCTEAANFDFSLPFYAVQSNWLDCSGTNTAFVWHAVHTWFPCSSFNQVRDPSTGDTVLNLHWLQSYSSLGQTGNNNFAEIDTATTDGSGDINTFSYPLNAYVEVVYRDTGWDTVSPSGTNNGPDGIWTWSSQLDHWEIDFAEMFGGVSGRFGTPSGRSSAIPWGNPGGFVCNWDAFAFQCAGWNVPGGFSMSSYHKWGSLITGNGAAGTGNKQICSWIDDVFQGCGDMNPATAGLTQRNWIKMWIGGDNPLPNKDIYVKYVRVWDCSNWNSGSSPANQCNGSTLFNSGGLAYWH